MESGGTATLPEVVFEEEVKKNYAPRYQVVLLDDDFHTYDYVVRMLRKLFGFSENQSYLLAEEVDVTGRVVLLMTTREHAELKQEQIHAFGADPLIPRCSGSMSAMIEPVPGS